ncbi:MAG: hypothetical protein K8T89_24955, partial [Planctomycetes bacterium]|nr:hypothetical protein [Planctomycetota bacterium]
PNIGMILSLVFFVLATFIAGTVAYFGYAEQEVFINKAKEAEKRQKAAEAEAREEKIRKVMLRMALGVEDPADRLLLVRELDPMRPQIKEEYDRMLRGLDPKVPKIMDKKEKKEVSAFTWRLLAMTKTQVDEKSKEAGSDEDLTKADPDVAPLMTVPDMIAVYITKANQAEAARKTAEDKAAEFKKQAESNNEDKGNFEKTFKDAIAKIEGDTKDKYSMLDAAFARLAQKHNNDGKGAADKLAQMGLQINEKVDEIGKLNVEINDLKAKILRYEDASGGKQNAVGVDNLNMEEKKGIVVRKEGNGFVSINLGSAKRLKPQVTFLVVSADVSWLALQAKEDSLKKNSYQLDRQPYEDNPYVKAGIEVVEITGPESARAKILFENEPIRNPVQVRDQIFNLAWKPDEEIRIAFAGLIDLDGDGLDNNTDFLRILERQGVIVDEYMQMKPLDFVKRDGRGMSIRTQYLVLAPDPRLDALPTDKDTPQTAQIKAAQEKLTDIKTRAKQLGVQTIEARKFLTMIGYKLPRSPAPPAYGAAAYSDGGIAPPMPEMKKDGN